jgi:hypothetical protein
MNDGGPAFPLSCATATGESPISSDDFQNGSGMSLRDYFAAAALQGYVASDMVAPSAAAVAHDCYELASAMIAEREKLNEKKTENIN